MCNNIARIFTICEICGKRVYWYIPALPDYIPKAGDSVFGKCECGNEVSGTLVFDAKRVDLC